MWGCRALHGGAGSSASLSCLGMSPLCSGKPCLEAVQQGISDPGRKQTLNHPLPEKLPESKGCVVGGDRSRGVVAPFGLNAAHQQHVPVQRRLPKSDWPEGLNSEAEDPGDGQASRFVGCCFGFSAHSRASKTTTPPATGKGALGKLYHAPTAPPSWQLSV